MQRFAVEFHLSYKGKSLEDTIATLHFDAETFADLWMKLELGESDLSTKQRLADALAIAEVDVKFDSFGFGNIYNRIGELVFDIENPEEFQFTSLSPEGEIVIEYDDEEDYSDDEDDETKTLH
jgi:hypothetical protein|tara:strand:+ start:43 stop:411 length:369 start_codon:yes stop_codon:yes gene_type:complete